MANRVLLGKHNTEGYGLFVSKSGQDVKSATGNNLIFNTNTPYGSGQIHQIMTLTIPGSGTPTQTGTITGLAYIPYIQITEFSGTTVKSIPSWWGRVSGGSGCLLPDTLVRTPEGEQEIQNLQIGDAVISYDTNEGQEVESYISNQSLHEVHSFVKVNGLRLTSGHPFWVVGKGWSCVSPDEYYRDCMVWGAEYPIPQMRKLKIGDQLLNEKVKTIETVTGTSHVFNIEIDKFQNYFADNILVHNGGGAMGGNPGGMPGGPGGGKGFAQIRYSEFRARVTTSSVTIFGAADNSASSGDTMNYTTSHHSNYALTYPSNIHGKSYKVIVYRIKTNQ